MPDIVDVETRSRMMAGIRGKDTKVETAIRKALFARGFRYRLHDPRLPGKPDVVLPRYRAVILVNGCFWHGHNCDLFKMPSTHRDFWRTKIAKSRQNDRKVIEALRSQEWRVLTVWGCAMKGRKRRPLDKIVQEIETWLRSDSQIAEIKGC